MSGNPVNYIDPTGEFGWPGAIAGGVVGAISGGFGAYVQGNNILIGAGIGATSGFVIGASGAWLGTLAATASDLVYANMLARMAAGGIANVLGQSYKNVSDDDPCWKFNWGSFAGSVVGGAWSGSLSAGAWGTSFKGIHMNELVARTIAGIPGAIVSSTSSVVGGSLGE